MPNKVLKVLKEFKLRCYTEDPMIKNIVSNSLNEMGIDTQSGQKRVVFTSQDNHNMVVKVGATLSGIRDNAAEVAMSKVLTNMINAGSIPREYEILFPKAELSQGGDAFMITQEKVQTFATSPDFNAWKISSNVVNTQQSVAEQWALFILEYRDKVTGDNTLLNDYTQGSKILGLTGVVSDISLTEPLNFGVRLDGNGKLRLAFLDLGSCVPYSRPYNNIVGNNIDYNKGLNCPLCTGQQQGKMMYISTDYNMNSSDIDVSNIVTTFHGVYGCTSNLCSNSVETGAAMANFLGGRIPYQHKDSVVYDNLIASVVTFDTTAAEFIAGLAVYGGYFIPNTFNLDLKDYYGLAVGVARKYGFNEQELTAMTNNMPMMYANYVLSSGQALISEGSPLHKLIAGTKQVLRTGTTVFTYDMFRQQVQDNLAMYSINNTIYISVIASVNFAAILSELMSEATKSSIFIDDIINGDAETVVAALKRTFIWCSQVDHIGLVQTVARLKENLKI